jgi:hypothetical protein
MFVAGDNETTEPSVGLDLLSLSTAIGSNGVVPRAPLLRRAGERLEQALATRRRASFVGYQCLSFDPPISDMTEPGSN